MAKQASDSIQMETETLYRELEPDANEILFGQKTLPDRPLTAKEELKRRKVIMKLVDQRLKFKLIELIANQVACKQQSERTQEASFIPTISQTINNSTPSHRSTSYHTEPNWFPQSNGLQHAAGHWQQCNQADWQSSFYPPPYGTPVNAYWNNNCNFQPFNVWGNMQNYHQNSKPQQQKRGVKQNPNLICPIVNTTNPSNAVNKDNTNTVEPKKVMPVASHSSNISMNCNLKSQYQSDVTPLPAENHLVPTAAVPQFSIVKNPTINRDRICERPLKQRRRRRYGRMKEIKKKIKIVAKESSVIVLPATCNVTRDGNDLWAEMKRLVTSIFRKEANQMEPLSSYEQRLHHKVLIEMSTNPNVLRSESSISQFVDRLTIEEIICKAKKILQQVCESNPQVQDDFDELREKVVSDLKAINDKDAEVVNANEVANGNVIVRPGKRFYIPMHRTIDAPFVAAVFDKATRMSEEQATILREALTAKMESVISLSRPKIIDPMFSGEDGSLIFVSANRKTFDLVKTVISGNFDGKWIGADLAVAPVSIKNPLARSDLKTVSLKFSEPTSDHFNKLMEQLKVDNPRLLVRRWELRKPPAGIVIDSTERIYVGVDIESLGIIEQMNRVADLGKSTVTFEICYDQSERNYLPDQSLLKQ